MQKQKTELLHARVYTSVGLHLNMFIFMNKFVQQIILLPQQLQIQIEKQVMQRNNQNT